MHARSIIASPPIARPKGPMPRCCGGSSSRRSSILACGSAKARVPASAQEPVTVGLVIPLSPPGDPTAGQLIRRGAELAIDYYNGKGGVLGGRKLQLSVQDSQGRPEGGVAAYRRVVGEDKAVAVTGF